MLEKSDQLIMTEMRYAVMTKRLCLRISSSRRDACLARMTCAARAFYRQDTKSKRHWQAAEVSAAAWLGSLKHG